MYERLKPVKGGICIFESFLLRVEVGDAWYYSIWFWKRKRGEEYFVVKAIETSVEWPLCHAHIVRSSKPIEPIGYRLVDRPCIPSILDFIPTPVERIGSIETVGDRLLCDEIPIQWDIGRIILLRVENAAGCARRKGVFEELAAPVHCSFYYYVFIWEIVRKIVRFLWRWKANEIEIGESQSIGNY